MLAAGLMLFPAIGCKDDQPTEVDKKPAAAASEPAAAQEDAVLDAMRRQATMPAANNPPPAPRSAPATTENPLFPKALF